MKTITLLMIILLWCTQGPTPKSDRENDGFAGPVKKVFVEWSPVTQSTSGIAPGTRCRQMTNVYDQAGRLLQHSVYPGSCGSDEIREEYIYAQDGSRTATTQEIRGKNSLPPPPPMATAAEKESGPSREMFRYDQSGRLTETSMIRPSGKLVYRTTYGYDENHRLTEIASFDGDGKLSSRRAYGYEGDKTVPSNFTYYGGDGKIYEQTVYSEYDFDSHGNWIKRKEYREQTYNRRDNSLTFKKIEFYEPTK